MEIKVNIGEFEKLERQLSELVVTPIGVKIG